MPLAVALVAAGLGWRAWRGGPPSALKIALAGPDNPLSASVAREVGLVLTDVAARPSHPLAIQPAGSAETFDYRITIAVARAPGSLRADLSVAAPGGGAAMWTGSFQRSEAETADLPREAASSPAPVVRSERLDADTLCAFLSTCARLTEMPDEATARLLRTVVERRPDFALARAELAYAEAYLAYPGFGFSPEQPRLRDSARRHLAAARARSPGLAAFISQSML